MNAKYLCLKIIKDGTQNGVITVQSTKGLMAGAKVYLSMDGNYNKELIVEDILDEKKLVLRENSNLNPNKFNCSHVVPYLHPKLTQPEQFIDTLQPKIEYESKKSGNLELDHLTENELALFNTISTLGKRIDTLEKKSVLDNKALWIYKSLIFKILGPIGLIGLSNLLYYYISRI